MAKGNRLERSRRFLGLPSGNEASYLAIGVVIGVILSRIVGQVLDDPSGFFSNLIPEFIGIVFTVFVLDRLDSNRENRLILERLLREMHSRYNPVALKAIEELRVMGHIEEGVMRGRDFRGSNWQEANLYRADLQSVDLKNADLKNADLYEANLEGARVTPEQLRQTKTMRWSTMPDGARYDGRFNLWWDRELMTRDKFNPSDPASAAAYYDVPVEAYLAGQVAEGHMSASNG